MEQRITFTSGNVTLEGMLDNPGARKGVVITHPHPLYGGDMDNPVVLVITECYRKAGYATLRFNFRGAGGSEGEYEEGTGETADLLAAVDHLKKEGIEEVVCSGYSFGTWICFTASLNHPIETDVMVAPPVTFVEFEQRACSRGPKLVISGANDSFAHFETLQELVPIWNEKANFHAIENADHFFSIHLGEVGTAIDNHLSATR